MSDSISRIGKVQPTFPVKPTQPSKKDRRSGQKQDESPKRESPDDAAEDDADGIRKSTIDEYI